MGDISYRTVDRGAPYAADQALVYCRRLFRWALDRDVYGLTGSPVAGISSKDHGVEKKPRTHILTDDDLRLLWKATDESGGPDYPLSPFVRLLLILGQRRGEVANMQWGDIDEAKAQWTIPQTKADKPHVVPLPKLAIDLLDSLPQFTGPYVFTTTDGTRPIQGFAKLKDRLDARLKGVGTLAP